MKSDLEKSQSIKELEEQQAEQINTILTQTTRISALTKENHDLKTKALLDSETLRETKESLQSAEESNAQLRGAVTEIAKRKLEWERVLIEAQTRFQYRLRYRLELESMLTGDEGEEAEEGSRDAKEYHEKMDNSGNGNSRSDGDRNDSDVEDSKSGKKEGTGSCKKTQSNHKSKEGKRVNAQIQSSLKCLAASSKNIHLLVEKLLQVLYCRCTHVYMRAHAQFDVNFNIRINVHICVYNFVYNCSGGHAVVHVDW